MKTRTAKKEEPVSKLYAKAIFELAQEKNEIDTVGQHIESLVRLLNEQPALRQALTAFMFSVEERQRLASELAQKLDMHPLVRRAVDLMISKGRIQVLTEMHEAYRQLVDQSKGTVRGTLVTVEPLTDAENADLAKAFGRKLNKQIVLESTIDKEILGGLIVKIQGLTFDGSLKTTIRRLRENLERQGA